MNYKHDQPFLITIRKTLIGWTVNRRWCITLNSRDRHVLSLQAKHPRHVVRTPG